MPPSRNAYSEVSLDSDWSEDAGSNFKQTGPKLKHCHTRLYILAMTICVVCALLNALLLMLMKQMQPAAPSATSLARHDLWTLRRPSQYMYLDEIERPVPPTPRHFDNFPLAVSHIDRSDAKRVIEHENKAHMGASGMYVPSERHVVITEHVSTQYEWITKLVLTNRRSQPSLTSWQWIMAWRIASYTSRLTPIPLPMSYRLHLL